MARHPLDHRLYVTREGSIERLDLAVGGLVPVVVGLGYRPHHLAIAPQTSYFFVIPERGDEIRAVSASGRTTTILTAPPGQHFYGQVFATSHAQPATSLYVLQSDFERGDVSADWKVLEVLGPFDSLFLGLPPASQVPLGGGTSSVPQRGILSTPVITPHNALAPTLKFKTWWEIESVDADRFDLMEVSARDLVTNRTLLLRRLNPLVDPNGRPDQPLASQGSGVPAVGAPPQWKDEEVSLGDVMLSEEAGGFGGHPFVIELSFDTRDENYNGFRGWLVDEIRLDADPSAAPRDTAPRPTRGRDTTTGRVLEAQR